MKDIERLAGRVVEAREAVEQMQEELGAMREELYALTEEYDALWEAKFHALTKESRLSWCTWCGAVRDSEYLREAYSLMSKSDDYSPPFPHTSTKHRACSECLPKLSTKSEAKKFNAMFNDDETDAIPSNVDTLRELCERIKLPFPRP